MQIILLFAMRLFSLLFTLLFALPATFLHPAIAQTNFADQQPLQGVLPGIDVLRLNNFELLRGKRVGLVTNQTGITRDGTSTIDVLFRAPGVQLRALFGPEHGIRGTVVAGKTVRGGRDTRTGLPIYSLYGSSKSPSASMLRGLDVLLFDMQDIGSRSYTYIATLGEVMKACARYKKPLIVLDRPNPLGGHRIEGNFPSRLSFVCPFRIPYVHGLTMGELAQMINGRGWLPGRARVALRVVPMLGYTRTMTWAQTGLPWIRTSPNVPYSRTPHYYAATGIVGELSTLSIGIGTPVPFEVAGAPNLNARTLASELNKRRLPGVRFEAVQWTPGKGSFRGRACSGVQVLWTDAQRAPLTRINFEIMDAARKVAPGLKFFRSSSQSQMFDMVCGTPIVRQMFQSGKSAAQIWTAWNRAAGTFAQQRRPYLLYR
jgi:uncharacterized protein YbbC (DUF1343 family)